ncbi:PepSY domain-containing protein [Caulobacter sp. 17J80-11]|uniref:PepSY-associated TM helix domain-containing protein n=1 Tax=Caulobacter sp. 17J80-11 TaxID=2763502 RepID=UPI00165377E8|nr:PepSY domain-containing protein [Caulobacter sp. 17J80-11]MBC6983275.1 PepSY domain-containing protein [Caulobacter sp. 17J80-11]
MTTLPPDAHAPAGALYRAVWRWHFIAGLLVLPFLASLAITGGLYLFKDEINAVLYRDLATVPAQSAPFLTPDDWAAGAAAELDGRVVQVAPPERPTEAARLIVDVGGGERLSAYVDPYDAHLIGATPEGGVMDLIKRIHSLDQFGFWANCLIEIAAGWAVVLVATGVYLWWPRGQRGGVVTVRATPKRRVFWRDLHAVTGLFAGAFVVFLAVTGMPWSAVWGKQVQRISTEAGLGRPNAPSASTSNHDGHADLPWALEARPTPISSPPGDPIGFARAAAIGTAVGLPKPFAINAPKGPDGVYALAYRPDRVEDTRTLYVDQYDGRVLGDVGYRAYGPAAKAIEWGISVHQGQQYGRANQLLMLAGCLGLLTLTVTAPVMWWKRRPKGSGLAVPPAPADPRVGHGLLAVIAPIAVFYPLVGASLLAALAAEWSWSRLRAAGWPRP